VLLLYGSDIDVKTSLRVAVAGLADETLDRFRVNGLPGVVGVDDCSLIAQLDVSNLGVERIPGSGRSISCKLNAKGWRHVWDLLEPFVERQVGSHPNAFQYLDSSNVLDWIISGSRSW